MMIAAGPVVTVKKLAPFLRRLFQAAVEIIKKKLPKATFLDFHGCGSFHRPPLPNFSFFLVLFLSLSKSRDRKSTRLNSSHSQISYAVFCLKKKNPTGNSPSSLTFVAAN